ncbi:hypothetical protein BsWGS_21377 [Bradybaena similaris]
MEIDTVWDEVTSTTLDRILRRHMSLEANAMKQHEELHLPSAEGIPLVAGAWMGRKIAVFTSGGDSQGMNAAVRAIVRVGMYLGCKVFYIKEGYQGMVDGAENIEEATWASTSNMIHVGGTVIGSARCMDFKERWGRLKAAQNLIEHGITNLIAIGGDGSLTGAYCFRKEWPSLLRELVDRNILSQDVMLGCSYLNIVGLVGSIDNDFCGTDMTIGVDSALHRIQEAVDDIMTTAVSHKRAFVLEIMGRMCGFLPLMAGISSEATAIFIPEDPPQGDWRQNLCDQLLEKSRAGEVRRTHIVLVAEGALDQGGNVIKCNDVQKVLAERMKMDVRVTVLGHVQRGGNTSAFDRILGTRMGAEAVVALMESTPDTPAYVISLDGHDIVRTPLMKAVEQTKKVGEMLEDRNFDEVVKLRGPVIYQNLYLYLLQHQVLAGPSGAGKKCRSYRIAMVHVGRPTGGMNAATRGFVGVCVSKGFEPVIIYDSWKGLCKNKVRMVEWNDVHHWTSAGGSLIGTSLETASEVGIPFIARKLDEHNISGLIIVGGFEAFQSAYEMYQKRKVYPELCIPINVIPATMSNNIPGVGFSLGCDTAMNQICKACDELKRSAFSIQKCVTIVEVGGGNCGCLATLAAIASGADYAFIKEEEFTIRDLQNVCKKLKDKMAYSGVQYGLILRNENANENLTTDFMQRLFNGEGHPVLTARSAILGHTQEGFITSPHDRCSGIKSGCKSAAWVILTMKACGAKQNMKVFSDTADTVTVTTTKRGKVDFTPVDLLARETDFQNCRPINQWWMKLRGLLDILSWSAEEPSDSLHDSRTAY